MKQLYPDRLYWINDVNYELYCFWKVAQTRNAELVKAVMRIREQATDGRELFYSLLEKYGTGDEFERAVRFFVLNRITFSGTVDSGGYSEGAFHGRFTFSAIRNLARVASVVNGVRITCLDYAEVVMAPGKGVFLFLDPPYYSVADSRLYGRRGELHLNFDQKLRRNDAPLFASVVGYLRRLPAGARAVPGRVHAGVDASVWHEQLQARARSTGQRAVHRQLRH